MSKCTVDMLTSEGKDGVFWDLLRMSILAKAKCQAWVGGKPYRALPAIHAVKVDRKPSELPGYAKAKTMSRRVYFDTIT